ncbi:hypothetical protein [Bradyrhizobium sp.]|uniref:head-tail joining protein n=1 Tax=Bradyrhizobium sp. TaxID=376 RepID=UPI0039E219B6
MTWGVLSDRMLRTCLRTFADREQDGTLAPVQYVRDGVQTPITDFVFDENYQVVEATPDGAAISSTKPVIGLARADIPGGEWEEGDKIVIRGVTYRCIDSQVDSEGGTKVILHRMP